MKSKIEDFYIRHNSDRICQGDIFRDFNYQEKVEIINKKIKVYKRIIPYLIVLTQDCDLESDFRNFQQLDDNHDKILQHILVCPAYPSEKLREGTHLKESKFNMQKINSNLWSQVKSNNNSRYHYLNKNKNKELQISEFVIDFKHYYSIPRDELYNNYPKLYLGTLNELFRERLSQRFANYLSRIGLPDLKKTNCEKQI